MIYETLAVGILLALFYTEIMEIYPGGIIVPAYMALNLDQPLRIGVTLGIALVCLFLFRLMSRFLILFGKRRFVLLILLGAVLSLLWFLFFPETGELKAVGWIIPGLLANNLEKQKIFPTLASLGTVSILTYFVIRILSFIF